MSKEQMGASAEADRATRASTEPASGLGHSAGIPSVISRDAMREQKAIRVFLLIRGARALIRSQQAPLWNPWRSIGAKWVAAACVEAVHAIERGEHHDEQAEWLSPLSPAQGMSAGTAETAQQAQGEARQPGPKDAPDA